VIHTVALVAEAIRPDGGWVGIGPTPEGLWIVLARLGASAWVRFFRDSEEAMARFLDYANLPLGPGGEIRPTLFPAAFPGGLAADRGGAAGRRRKGDAMDGLIAIILALFAAEFLLLGMRMREAGLSGLRALILWPWVILAQAALLLASWWLWGLWKRKREDRPGWRRWGWILPFLPLALSALLTAGVRGGNP
jgi:hypothetical protein